MIEVKILTDTNKYEVLELEDSATINVESSNPSFDIDSLDRKFSFPFQIPLTPKNSAIRRHSHRLDAKKRSGVSKSEIRFAGDLIVSGEMRQISVGNEAEEVTVANNPMGIWPKLREIKINEILETFDLMDGRPTPYWKFSMPDTGSYEMGIDGVNATATAATFPDIPAAGQSIATQLNAVYPDIAEYDIPSNRLHINANMIAVHPFVGWTRFTLFSFENVALSRLHAVRDHVMDTNNTPIDSHCFPIIEWEGFYGDKNFLWNAPYGFRIFNHVAGGIFMENLVIETDELYWHNSVLPCVRIPYILNKIAEALGDYVWDGAVWADADFQKLIHVPNLALDEVTTDIYEATRETKKANTLKPYIDLNNHVPAMTAADFIRELCTTFNLYLDSNEGVLKLIKKQISLQNEAINLQNRTDKNYAIEPSEIIGWKLAAKKNLNDLYSDPAQLLPVESGNMELLVQTSTSMYMKGTIKLSESPSGAFVRFVKAPYTKQPGKSPALDNNATKSTMPLTLLFCHELQSDEDGEDYLYASNDNLNYDGDQVGEYTLSPSGEFGLYEKWHKGVIEYSTASTVSIVAYLHPGELQQLMSWERSRVKINLPEGQVIMAVKSIRATAKVSGLLPTRLELLLQ